MLHWEGCEVTLLVGTSVCIGWLRSMLQGMKSVNERTQSEQDKNKKTTLDYRCFLSFGALTVAVRLG